MPTFIHIGGGGADGSSTTVTNASVLNGVTFINQNDEVDTGTITNYGAVTNTAPYTGEAGYYSGINIGSVGNAISANVLSGVTFSNTSGAQTGSMTNQGTCSASVTVGGTFTGSGYYSSLTINGPTLSGNAAAGQVLSGYTFYNTSGTKQTGTITNKGSVTCSSLAPGATCAPGAGYYSCISVTAASLSGNAAADQVLSGYTFYNTSGTKQTGSMSNKGAATCTSLAAGSTYTGTAGYYSSISITAASASYSGNASAAQVLYGYTFMNSSGAQTGTLRLYRNDNDITSSWQCASLGWTPTYYGAATTNTDGRTKCYVSGTTLYWCLNGSGTTTGRVIAST